MNHNQGSSYTGLGLVREDDGEVRNVTVRSPGGNEQPLAVQDYINREVQPPLNILKCQHGLPYSSCPPTPQTQMLEPCPFCGSTKVEESLHGDFIECLDCNASGPMGDTSKSAADLWNGARR